MFQECGWMSFVIAALAFFATLFGFVALALAALRSRWGPIVAAVALAVSCSPPAAGAVGTMLGRQVVDDVLQGGGIDPAQKERIRAIGEAEAQQCANLGFLGGGVPVFLGVVALAVALVRRKTATAG